MIYGINFGRATCQGRGHKEYIKLPGMRRGEHAHLVGVCDTAEEAAYMVQIATNGHRQLHITEPSKHGIGIYVM